MPIIDSDFDNDTTIAEQRNCPNCGGLLRDSNKRGILYECIGCGYEESQWENPKAAIVKAKVTNPPKLEFYPNDEVLFKKLLIEKKRAKRTFYDKGGNIVRTNFWNIRNFTEDSKLRGNIESSQVYRDASQNGITKIRFEIEGYKNATQIKQKQVAILHKKAKTPNLSVIAEKEEQMEMERTLKDDSISIFEAVTNIENGKYVMPAFQRQYVWDMEQIEKL